VAVGWNDTTAQISSVTDTAGNIYKLAVGPTRVSGFLSQSIFYAKNIVAAAAGANAVTVTLAQHLSTPTSGFGLYWISFLSKKRSKKELTKRPPFLVKSLVCKTSEKTINGGWRNGKTLEPF
jgi:hypothetical protein